MSTLLVADIGGTTVKIGFVVDGVPQTYQRVFPTNHLRRPDPVEGLAEMISLAIDEAKLQPHAIVSTVPGFLDKTATHVLLAVNIPELNGCALVDEIARSMRDSGLSGTRCGALAHRRARCWRLQGRSSPSLDFFLERV